MWVKIGKNMDYINTVDLIDVYELRDSIKEKLSNEQDKYQIALLNAQLKEIEDLIEDLSSD